MEYEKEFAKNAGIGSICKLPVLGVTCQNDCRADTIINH